MDPASGGTVGQVIEFNHETGARCVAGNSLYEWLATFSEALDRGEYYYDAEEMCILPVS